MARENRIRRTHSRALRLESSRVHRCSVAERAQCYRNSSSTTRRDPRGHGRKRGERERENTGAESYELPAENGGLCVFNPPTFRKAMVMFEHEK